VTGNTFAVVATKLVGTAILDGATFLNGFIRTVGAVGIAVTQPRPVNAVELVQTTEFIFSAADKGGVVLGSGAILEGQCCKWSPV
jgi:hypothetical protein